MNLISLQNIDISFGGLPVLADAELHIEKGEKICLIGRNGEGKSTLLKIIEGSLQPDGGKIQRSSGLKTALLSQEFDLTDAGTIFEVVSAGLGDLTDLLTRHHAISQELTENSPSELMTELQQVEDKLEHCGGWQAQQRVETILSKLELSPDLAFNNLSGGFKKRVMLAQALVKDPDILLLDEPTNHLDLASIAWLEQFLLNSEYTLVFITHDRFLADKIATRILDLDRGRLTSWPGNMRQYLQKKDEVLEIEALHAKKFDKKLSQEEKWIRQGIKARRTRNEGRVRELLELRSKRKERREKSVRANIQITEGESSGKIVARAKNISFQYEGSPLIDNFSTTIFRGDRVGIIGPNGCGKTTLLKILLGKLQQDTGTVDLGVNLNIAYFDQLRMQLDEEKSVADNVGEGKEIITVNGRNKHILGYLKDFLFTPDRARSPVKILSGGERNRLLLAKLFTKPANVLVLDEPTNDLDVETLELLEEITLQFKGTVLLVSHDRAFLNNVVTNCLVFEGNGTVQEYAGGYDDWLMQKKSEEVHSSVVKEKKSKKKKSSEKIRKLNFKEKFELEELPISIEKMEKEQEEIFALMADPAFYQESGEKVSSVKKRSEELEKMLEQAFSRWEELESIQNL